MDKEIKCPHEDDIRYGKLHQVDGTPQYEVVCMTCGKKGIILLEEGKNIWSAN